MKNVIGDFQGAGMPDMTGRVSGLYRSGFAPPGVRGIAATRRYGLPPEQDTLPHRRVGELRFRGKYPPQGIRQARPLPLRGLRHGKSRR